jgi:hypothetical protein
LQRLLQLLDLPAESLDLHHQVGALPLLFLCAQLTVCEQRCNTLLMQLLLQQ